MPAASHQNAKEEPADQKRCKVVMKKLIGPFSQIVTMQQLPLKGPLPNDGLGVLEDAGVVVKDGIIKAVGKFDSLYNMHPDAGVETIYQPAVLLPGFIDCHTHICYGGNRSMDYSMRIAGKSYLDIARSGGGIWSSVEMTRKASPADLLQTLISRIKRHVSEGVTTIEIKSGYGLDVENELKMLRAINEACLLSNADVVATCLAAHIKPRDFDGDEKQYLKYLVTHLWPVIKKERLCRRADIFIEETAFRADDAAAYLMAVELMGFSSTVHADQFSASGSQVAIKARSHSADHLEASGEKEIDALAKSETVAVVLPGASIGLGIPFAPARKLLDAGACVAIASDWNPGSAPNGDLLMQASLISAYEKLNTTETMAGLTFRAAHALRLSDRGIIAKGMKAHLQAYPTNDYREILYHQGKLKPFHVWVN
jgi:imidazolonepropionase